MIGVIGAGAFGTALAVALGRNGREVVMWCRSPEQAEAMQRTRLNPTKLPDVELPETVTITAEIGPVLAAEAVLLSVPMQSLHGFLTLHPGLDGLPLVACCKGLDLASLLGPSDVIRRCCPNSNVAVLTGPSFAADIAKGLPTALTLASADGTALQHLLSTPVLRLYRSPDIIGAELGGALKNVMAIASGVVIGAGLGDSARAALMTRGYAEMTRLALALGARAETLAGLSGFGDLVLTCTSPQSRNFRFGLALGRQEPFDASITVEGVATAKAVSNMAEIRNIEMPITQMIDRLIDRKVTLPDAVLALLSRPLKQE